MTQEQRHKQTTNDQNTNDLDVDDLDENEDDEGDAQVYGPGPIPSPRCRHCNRTLTGKTLDGFLVWYCEHDRKYVCPQCYYPELQQYQADGESGLHCTKLRDTHNANCENYFPRSK